MNKILFILICFLVAGLFFSCSTTEPEIGDDSELIQLIKNAPNKQVISLEDLPSTCKNVLGKDFSEDIVEVSRLAPGLGYEVEMMRCKGVRMGEKIQVYFNLKGRKLEDRGGKGRGGKEECFEFVLPITFVMPDDSTITVEEKEDWIEIRSWYKANPNVREKPSLQYPADIIFIKDRTTWTLNSDEDLRRAYEACKGRG